MANEEHLGILKKGLAAWNKWRQDNRHIKPDLIEANLIEANLSEVDLSEANLYRADLSGAMLIEANLLRANLSGARLLRANLTRANFIGANLGGAKLYGAHLWGANLKEADLSGADFSRAMLGYTTFGNVDLSTVRGLETVTHQGPSTVGIDTIYRSKGQLPGIFLRGAGVPDNFIEYMHSLVGTAFEFYSCFISYSRRDEDFANRIYEGLQNNGVRCWFAPHHVQAGKKLHEQIDTAIRLHERLLLILSPNSIKSEWVQTEISKARKRELREGRRVLFPISLNIPYKELQDWEFFDPDTGKDSAREICEYYIPDFTHWKDHDSFQEEFRKLLRDLKKSDSGTEAQGRPQPVQKEVKH